MIWDICDGIEGVWCDAKNCLEVVKQARLFAADGQEIKHVLRFNTETGVVTTLRKNPGSSGFAFCKTGPIEDTAKYPAPLTVVPMEDS